MERFVNGLIGIGIIWLVVYLIRRKKKRKVSAHRSPAPSRSPITPSSPSTTPVTSATPLWSAPKKETDVITVPGELNGAEIKYHYEDVDVCIIKGKEPVFSAVEPGAKVTLRQEPENAYDSKAVAVYAAGMKLGYLYRGKMQDIANDFLKRGDPIWAHVSSVNDDDRKIRMFIAFYRNAPTQATVIASAPRDRSGRRFRLTANTGKTAQEALEYCSEGDEVEYEYDGEKGKYIANANGDYIGAFPAAANDLLDSALPVHIDSLDSNDADKIVVYARIDTD